MPLSITEKLQREKILFSRRPFLRLLRANRLRCSGGGCRYNFRWRKSGGVAVKSYQFQVAKSPIFNSDSIVLVRDSLVGQSFAFSGVVARHIITGVFVQTQLRDRLAIGANQLDLPLLKIRPAVEIFPLKTGE